MLFLNITCILIVLSSFVEESEGRRKCHQCESFVSCGKDDEFCMGELCFKKRIRDGKGSFKYAKGCSARGSVPLGCQELGEDGMEKTCYCDDKDEFCNAAALPSRAAALLLPVTLALARFIH